jgi:hypothetical protein
VSRIRDHELRRVRGDEWAWTAAQLDAVVDDLGVVAVSPVHAVDGGADPSVGELVARGAAA